MLDWERTSANDVLSTPNVRDRNLIIHWVNCLAGSTPSLEALEGFLSSAPQELRKTWCHRSMTCSDFYSISSASRLAPYINRSGLKVL